MSSAKKATKSPAKSARRVPAKSEAQLPVVRESRAPAKKESRMPAKSEARLPVKKETQVPAVQAEAPPREAGLPAGAAPGANPYLPEIATVAERIQETPLIVTLRLLLDDAAKMEAFAFKPGQVGQLSVFGSGEATFVINSPPSQQDYLQMSIMKAGEVTGALHKLAAGDKVGLRAPLGNFFPYAQWKGKDVFFIGGGIGMAPIRTIMLHLLDNRQESLRRAQAGRRQKVRRSSP